MSDNEISGYRTVGRFASLAVFGLGVVYAIVTALGLLSLDSPDEAIGDPYFTMMELLIILIAPLMVVGMLAVYACAAPARQVYAALALIAMIFMAVITSCVHFVILTTGNEIEATGNPLASLLISFEWPSVVYALDILAWDWFFAISMLCGAVVFRRPGLERAVSLLMLVSGVLSLAGLIGVPLGDMQYRNIGIIGYGVVAPFAFLLLGLLLGRTPNATPSPEG